MWLTPISVAAGAHAGMYLRKFEWREGGEFGAKALESAWDTIKEWPDCT